jgi:hypothetical protein
MMGIRIVICVDLASEDLVEGYTELWHGMAKSGLDWESSDEWYAEDGQEIVEEAQQDARMEAIAKRRKSRPVPQQPRLT